MTAFKVTVKRVITTTLEIEAASATEARMFVATYGKVEAVSDFPVLDEEMLAHISSVEPL